MPQKSHVLVRRDSRVPYFRKSIPETLRQAFGRREFICSLRTSDPSEVASRASALLSKAEELLTYARSLRVAGRLGGAELASTFDQYRDAICADAAHVFDSVWAANSPEPSAATSYAVGQWTARTPRRYAFHPSMTSRLLGRHRSKVLATDDAWRRTLKPGKLSASRADLAMREQTLIDEIALNDLRNAWRSASALLERESIDFSLAPLPAMQSFVERHLREELELVRVRIARLNGADLPTPQPPPRRLGRG